MTRAAWWLPFVLVGCALDPAPDAEEVVPDDDPVDIDIGDLAARCPIWGCGTNTSIGPDGQVFDTLDTQGYVPNDHGNWLHSPTRYGAPLKLWVERDRLAARNLWTNEIYRGYQLADTRFWVEGPDGGFEVMIAEVSEKGVYYWAGDKTDSTYTYLLWVRRPQEAQWISACPDTAPPPPGWMSAHHSVIFAGDGYTADMRVQGTSGTSWMQIACANSYPAKLHLLRHTDAGQYGRSDTLVYPSTIAQRTAYLKALVADYYGDGTSYTWPGVPLNYTDANSYHTYASPPLDGATPEAIWDQYGAICVNTPRIPWMYFWLPNCSSVDLDKWRNRGYVLTGVP